MRAEFRILRSAILISALFASHAAHAQDDGNGTPAVDYTLTQEGAPAAKPWDKPGLLSVTIDRDGKDFFEAHLTGELLFDLSHRTRRSDAVGAGAPDSFTIGPKISWDRSSKPGDLQDELKFGLTGHYIHDAPIFQTDAERTGGTNVFFYSATANIDYARTAVFPDKEKAPCNVANTNPTCRKQYNESLKGQIRFFPYLPDFEDLLSAKTKWAYSVRPEFQLAHDQILDGVRDSATLDKVTGGYTSALAGLGVNVSPSFISPRLEFNLTGQIRQRLAVAASRGSSVEKTAELLEMSATYYLNSDDGSSKTKKWRAGISLIVTEGSDPFEGKPKASTIMLAFRIGHL